MPGIVTRLFEHPDVAQALRLSDSAGWNQIADDWHRILDLEPNGCLGAWSDGELVGTSTFVTYGGTVAWIGMVLVHPDYQRQGIGRHLFEETMARLHSIGIGVIGLDATDLGRPLYQSEGFVDMAPIVRWQGVLNPAVPGAFRGKMRGTEGSQQNSHSALQSGIVSTARDKDLDEIVSLDRKLSGLDRRLLLAHFFGEERSVVFMLAEGKGYGVLRPGRFAWQFGPIVVQERVHAADLFSAAADLLDGKEIIIDSVEISGFREILLNAGLAPRRQLSRMTYDRPFHVLANEHTVAATCFAWG
jgi:GNAT superfamily N-acetyltransferase